MSMKHLGERFDIHTGGNDNKFPHHEDEIAQSEGAVGHPVVSIWVHGGFLQMGGQKMAKSARNIYRVTDLADHGIDPLAYRLLLLRHPLPERDGLQLGGARGRAAQARRASAKDGGMGARRFDAFGRRNRVRPRFREAVASDLDMPAALVVMNEAVSSDLPVARSTPCLRPGTPSLPWISNVRRRADGSRPTRCAR